MYAPKSKYALNSQVCLKTRTYGISIQNTTRECEIILANSSTDMVGRNLLYTFSLMEARDI